MQLELAPERLDQRRERALVASLGPLEIDGHRIMTPGPSETDRRSVSRHRGVFDVAQPRIGDELMQKQRWGSALARGFAVWRTGLTGPGFGFVGTAGQVLTLTLVPAEKRAASTALRRVAGNFGLGLGATVAGFIVAATHHHLQAFQGLYLFDAVTFVVFALVVLVWIPDPGLADAPSASEGVRGFRAVARDRLLLALIAGNLALVMIGGAFFSYILPPFAEAHTPVGPVGIGVVVFINTFFIVVAQVPATRVVARMRRTHALFATSAIFAVGLLAVLLATLTHSTLAATTVLAGVAIVIAVAECGQFIVLGPLVAEIAPPHLLGRYMSLYQLSFMVGVALGPAVGGVLLGTSPDTIWWGGALALALTGAGFLRLGNRIPDPLSPTKSPPLQAASEAT